MLYTIYVVQNQKVPRKSSRAEKSSEATDETISPTDPIQDRGTKHSFRWSDEKSQGQLEDEPRMT